MTGPFNPNLFHEKYRIKTARANWWEYYEGIYHIIIVTAERKHYFGEISCPNGKNEMHFSEIGKFVNDEIPKIMDHYSYAYVPVWTVMPDHVHLIIMIDVRGRANVETCGPHVSTLAAPPKLTAPKTGSVSLVINQFKRAITMYARTHQIPFKWQSRFYDVILFDQIGFDRTRKYIENNVAKWHHDRENHLPDNPKNES